MTAVLAVLVGLCKATRGLLGSGCFKRLLDREVKEKDFRFWVELVSSSQLDFFMVFFISCSFVFSKNMDFITYVNFGIAAVFGVALVGLGIFEATVIFDGFKNKKNSLKNNNIGKKSPETGKDAVYKR